MSGVRHRLRTHAHTLHHAPQLRSVQQFSSRRAVKTNTAAPEAEQQTSVAELAAQAVRGRFYIPAEEVQQLKDAANCTIDTLMLAMLEEASQSARPPISHYQVG